MNEIYEKYGEPFWSAWHDVQPTETGPAIDKWFSELETRVEQVGGFAYVGHHVCDGCGISTRNFDTAGGIEIKRWKREHYPHHLP
jgi:hypothetical protein